MKKFNEVEEKFINNALTKCINEYEVKNYKLKIRNYLKSIFKNDTNYDLEKIIEETQIRAEKLFN